MKLDLSGDDVIVRMCVRIEDEDAPMEGSEKVPCDECGSLVWRDKEQVLRNPKTGEVVHETHVLCVVCNFQHMALNPEAELVLPTGEDLMDLVRRLMP